MSNSAKDSKRCLSDTKINLIPKGSQKHAFSQDLSNKKEEGKQKVQKCIQNAKRLKKEKTERKEERAKQKLSGPCENSQNSSNKENEYQEETKFDLVKAEGKKLRKRDKKMIDKAEQSLGQILEESKISNIESTKTQSYKQGFQEKLMSAKSALSTEESKPKNENEIDSDEDEEIQSNEKIQEIYNEHKINKELQQTANLQKPMALLDSEVVELSDGDPKITDSK